MAIYGGPDIVTDGLVLNLDAANMKSFDPVNTNTELLLHMDGANNSTSFVDSSKNGFTVTANGNAKISTDQSKFGGSSAYFDGNGDWLEKPSDTSWNFGTGDFTIELWIRFNFIAGHIFFVCSGTGVNFSPLAVSGWYFGYFNGINFGKYDGTTQTNFNFAWTPVIDTWYHVAVTRSGTSLRAFVDGVQIGTTQTSNTDFTRINTTTPFWIGRGGANGTLNNYFNGYIDELKIVKGKALYTSNFTPERKPYLDGNKIYDLSGETNNGTLVNGPAYSSSNGGSLIFDGSDDALTTATVTNSLTTQQKEGPLTYEYWLQPTANIKAGYVESNSAGQWYSPGSATNQGLSGDNSYNYGSGGSIYVGFGFAFGLNGLVLGVHKFAYHAPILVDYQSYTGISHLVIVKNVINCSYYLNGVFRKTSVNIAGGSSIIGDTMSRVTNPTASAFMGLYSGEIFSTRFYNRALSANEISQNYNALKGRFGL